MVIRSRGDEGKAFTNRYRVGGRMIEMLDEST
jgi:hypothetical protein